MSSQPPIKVKSCNQGCNTQIYWDVLNNQYNELNTKKKHICPNWNKSKSSSSTYKPKSQSQSTWTPKPKEEKVPMSNSLEVLEGKNPIWIRQQYEYLSDLINIAKGRVHGSQSNIVDKVLSVIVYYEVPEGYRGNVQESFKQFLQKINIDQVIDKYKK